MPSQEQVLVPLQFRSSIWLGGGARRPLPHFGRECARICSEARGAVEVAGGWRVGIGGGGGARGGIGIGANW